MTDRIWVDFNSRDENGLVPAARRRIAHVPPVGTLVDSVDDEGNRCLARVTQVGPSVVTLEPLWQTFAGPDQPRVVPGTEPASFLLSWTRMGASVESATRSRGWRQRSFTSGAPSLAGRPR